MTGPAVYPLIMDIITISEPGGSHRRLLRRQLPAPLLQPGQHRQPAQRHRLPEAHPLHPALAQARAAARRRQRRGDHRAHRRRPRRAVPGRRRPGGYQRSPPTTRPTGRCSTPASQALLHAARLPVPGAEPALADRPRALDQLLACWAPIGTAGPDSLYQAMFLTPTLLQQDPGAQTATVAATVNVGDVLHTAINLPSDQPGQLAYTVQPGDTAAAAAAAIAAALNAATTHRTQPPACRSAPGSTPRALAASSRSRRASRWPARSRPGPARPTPRPPPRRCRRPRRSPAR